MISHVLTISHVLNNFRSSDVLYDVTPYGSNVVYISLYSLLCPCTTYMAFSIWGLSTFTGVTPTHSCGNIFEWGQTLIECTYLLVRMTPMIWSLNFLNRFPWSGLVIKYPVISFVGNHSAVTSFLFIKSVTRNNCMFMFSVLLLSETLLFFSISMELWFYWQTMLSVTL